MKDKDEVLSIVAHIKRYIGAKNQFGLGAVVTYADGRVETRGFQPQVLGNDDEVLRVRQLLANEFSRLRQDDAENRFLVFGNTAERLWELDERNVGAEKWSVR